MERTTLLHVDAGQATVTGNSEISLICTDENISLRNWNSFTTQAIIRSFLWTVEVLQTCI